MNNKGFTPSAARVTHGSSNPQYSYGLFADVGDGAEIKNLKLTNVDIDTTRYSAAKGDSVGALIGYSDGSITVKNIEVSGSVKASDAVGGILGRAYNEISSYGEGRAAKLAEFSFTVENCKNNAAITAGTEYGEKCGGIVGFLDNVLSKETSCAIKNNANTGVISGGYTSEGHPLAANIVVVGIPNAGIHFDYTGNKNGTAATALSDWSTIGVKVLG